MATEGRHEDKLLITCLNAGSVDDAFDVIWTVVARQKTRRRFFFTLQPTIHIHFNFARGAGVKELGGKSDFLRQKYPCNPSKFNAQDLQLAVNEANNVGAVDNR